MTGRAATPARPLTPRARSWLLAAVAGLLVAVYLVGWLTWAGRHLPPEDYRQLAPGVAATSQGAEFRLLGLRQTTRYGRGVDGPASPVPDAVWVVADLEVTRLRVEKYLTCTLTLVGPGGRAWETSSILARPDGVESCVPDDAVTGRTYPVQVCFEVPVSDVGDLAGVALPSYSGARAQLLRPPA